MSYRHTLEAALESLQDIEELIKGFPDNGDVPSIELDLSLQKLRNIYELLLVLKKPVELSMDQSLAATSVQSSAPVSVSPVSAPVSVPPSAPCFRSCFSSGFRAALFPRRFQLRFPHRIPHRFPFPFQLRLPLLSPLLRPSGQEKQLLKPETRRSFLTGSKVVQPSMKPYIKVWDRKDIFMHRESRLKT